MWARPRAAEARPSSLERLPTLTEVVEVREPALPPAAPARPRPDDPEPAVERTAWPLDAPSAAALAAAVRPALDEAALVAQVLESLAPQLDALFEQRLADALAPALARAAEGLIRDAREALGPLLRTLVQDAVRRAVDELR